MFAFRVKLSQNGEFVRLVSDIVSDLSPTLIE